MTERDGDCHRLGVRRLLPELTERDEGPLQTPSGEANATVRRGKGESGMMHSNLGDPSGNFRWESWDSGEDHIANPKEFYDLFWE